MFEQRDDMSESKLENAERDLKQAAKAYGGALGDDAVAWRDLARAAMRYAAAWTEDGLRKAGAGLAALRGRRQ